MQILTYNWISNFVEQILKNHNTELYIFKKENKKGDIKFSAHEAYLE
jgi:hypothetical protein